MDPHVISCYLPQKESYTSIHFTYPYLYTVAFLSEGWILKSQTTEFQIWSLSIPYTWSSNICIFSLNIATLILPNDCNNSNFIQQYLSKIMKFLLTK